MPRLIGWWLVPIAWVAMAAMDWLVYGTPLAWVAQTNPMAPLHSFMTLLFNPTVGVLVGIVLLAPIILRTAVSFPLTTGTVPFRT